MLTLLLLACIGGDKSDSVDSFTSAGSLMERSCAPNDGEAYQFELPLDGASLECTTTPTGAWALFQVWDSAQFPLSAGDTFTLDSTGSTGSGWYYPSGSSSTPTQASSGELTLDSYTEGAGGEGSWSMTLTDGSVLNGTFSATWCESDILCG